MADFNVCKNCGANIKNGLQFCKKCGADVKTGIIPTAHPIGVTIKKQKKDTIIKITAIVIGLIIVVISVYFFIKKAQ